jgi:hypothetical protein
VNTIIAVALVCATVIWLTERFGGVIRYRYGPRPDIRLDPMPDDLASIVAQYSEAWAQADVSRAMQELHALTGNWDVVRTRFTPP